LRFVKGEKLFVRIDRKAGEMAMTDQDFQDHLVYVEKLAGERYLLGGGFSNTDGGMLLFKAKNIEEAQEFSNSDPIIERGFYRCEVFEWKLVVLSETCLESKKNLYESHCYSIHKFCPCKIGEDAVSQAFSIYKASADIPSFVNEMEKQRVIGRRIWFAADENTIFISKKYACESGGGCPENQTLIGERCHCGHYNRSTAYQPKYYCKCGAEFYRPMFASIFGDDVLIEPYKTVLSGDDECVLAIRIGKTEEKANAHA